MGNSVKIDGQRSADGNSLASPPRRVHAWLAPGQDWIIEIGGVEIVIRLVERRGRRARVAVDLVAQHSSDTDSPRGSSTFFSLK